MKDTLTGLNESLDDDSAKFLARNKSPKLPDPPIFTDGIDPTWDDWSTKMEEKLRVNKDWYSTPEAQVAYVVSRIGGKAAKTTITRRIRGCTDPYTLYTEVMDDLSDIYEDTDRKENAGRDYEALVQGNQQPFMEFYSDFIHLASILGTDLDTTLRNLRGKIREGLRQSWDTVGGFSSLKTAKEYLRKLDNNQRSEHLKKALVRAKTTSTTFKKTTVTPRQALTSEGTTSIPPVRVKPEFDVKNAICHNCGKGGHIRRDCTVKGQTEAGKKAYQEAKIHALLNDEDFSQEDSNGEDSDSSSDSGKA